MRKECGLELLLFSSLFPFLFPCFISPVSHTKYQIGMDWVLVSRTPLSLSTYLRV